MSDPESSVSSRVSAVPYRMRQLCAVSAAVVVLVTVIVAVLLKQSSTGVVSFHTSDQVAMVVLGLILGTAILLLARARVDADARGIRVRNIVATHQLGWELVQSVRFDPDAQWASLRLTNGEEMGVLAVQAVDGERAVRSVEALRALLAAARGPVVPEPPRLHYD